MWHRDIIPFSSLDIFAKYYARRNEGRPPLCPFIRLACFNLISQPFKTSFFRITSLYRRHNSHGIDASAGFLLRLVSYGFQQHPNLLRPSDSSWRYFFSQFEFIRCSCGSIEKLAFFSVDRISATGLFISWLVSGRMKSPDSPLPSRRLNLVGPTGEEVFSVGKLPKASCWWCLCCSLHATQWWCWVCHRRFLGVVSNSGFVICVSCVSSVIILGLLSVLLARCRE